MNRLQTGFQEGEISSKNRISRFFEPINQTATFTWPPTSPGLQHPLIGEKPIALGQDSAPTLSSITESLRQRLAEALKKKPDQK